MLRLRASSTTLVVAVMAAAMLCLSAFAQDSLPYGDLYSECGVYECADSNLEDMVFNTTDKYCYCCLQSTGECRKIGGGALSTLERPEVGCLAPHCNRCVEKTVHKCERCDDGYSVTREKTCTGLAKCEVDNCAVCLTGRPTLCDTCDKGFLVTSHHTCAPRETCEVENCAICSQADPTVCDTCGHGYDLNEDATACIGDGPNKTWSVCSPSHYCEDETLILRASVGDRNMCICCYKSPRGDVCVGASYGFCRTKNCDVCGSNGTCVACAPGFSLAGDGTCVSCPVDDCASCDFPGQCAICSSGFALVGNVCVPK